MFDAVSTALSNAFRKRGQKPNQYNEKPYSLLHEEERTELSEEEKKKRVDALFNHLQIMQFNFELEKKNKLETNGADA